MRAESHSRSQIGLKLAPEAGASGNVEQDAPAQAADGAPDERTRVFSDSPVLNQK
jgi:hypothetical protein